MVRCVNCAMMPDRHKRLCYAYKKADGTPTKIARDEIWKQMSCPRYKPKYRAEQVTAK